MNEILAVYITATIAALIAIWGLIYQRNTARRHTTVERISNMESNPEMIEARKLFIELAKSPGDLARWAEADQEQTEQAFAIAHVLNNYELMSIGIKNGIIDYEIFRSWHKTSAINFWYHGAPFVMRIRERVGNNMIYNEFEELVGWLKGDKKPPRRRFGLFF